jgi:hypothetical protein
MLSTPIFAPPRKILRKIFRLRLPPPCAIEAGMEDGSKQKQKMELKEKLKGWFAPRGKCEWCDKRRLDSVEKSRTYWRKKKLREELDRENEVMYGKRL